MLARDGTTSIQIKFLALPRIRIVDTVPPSWTNYLKWEENIDYYSAQENVASDVTVEAITESSVENMENKMRNPGKGNGFAESKHGRNAHAAGFAF